MPSAIFREHTEGYGYWRIRWTRDSINAAEMGYDAKYPELSLSEAEHGALNAVGIKNNLLTFKPLILPFQFIHMHDR